MTIDALVTAYGLPALFAGGIVEGDGVAFLGGVLAHRGLMSFPAAALSVAAGAFLADQTLFLFGRHVIGRERLQRLAQNPVGARVLGAFDARPDAMMFGFRFVYGTRTITPLLLGARDVSHLRFFVLNLIAVLIWATFVTALGFGLGAVIEQLVGRLPLHQHLMLVLVIVSVIVALFIVFRSRRRT